MWLPNPRPEKTNSLELRQEVPTQSSDRIPSTHKPLEQREKEINKLPERRRSKQTQYWKGHRHKTELQTSISRQTDCKWTETM